MALAATGDLGLASNHTALYRPRFLTTLALATVAWLPLYHGFERLLKVRGITGAVASAVQYAKDGAVFVLLAVALILFLNGGLKVRRPFTPLIVATGFFCLYLFAILAAHAFAINALYALRVYGEPIFGGVALGVLVQRGGRRDAVPGLLAALSVIIVTYGILQLLFPLSPLNLAIRQTMVDETGDLPANFYSSVGDTVRSFSTLELPNDLGFFGVIVALMSYAPSPMLERRPLFRRVVRALAVAACAVSLSRSALLAACTGGATLAITYLLWDPRVNGARILRRAVIGLAVGSVVLMGLWAKRDDIAPIANIMNAVNGSDFSARAHVESLHVGTQLALMQPAGYGLGRVGARAGLYGTEERVTIVESAYLLIALELGWLGLGIVVMAIVLALSGVFAVARSSTETAADRQWARVAAAVLVAQATVYIVLPTIEVLETGVLVWANLGFILCRPARRAA